MLLDEFGEEFVFALKACLPVGDSLDSEKTPPRLISSYRPLWVSIHLRREKKE